MAGIRDRSEVYAMEGSAVSVVIQKRYHPHNLTISKAGLEFIKGWESLRLAAYQDVGGVWTIGYGHTEMVFKGQTISPAQAESLFRHDIFAPEKAIRDHVSVALKQSEYDALVSFIFNLGARNFLESTLLEKLNKMDYVGAADEFLKWDLVHGKVSPGLSNRRRDERLVFSRP